MSGGSVRRGQRASGRAGWGSISREQVVQTALAALRSGGLEQVTIRGLASELGVAPMSLYYHVRDKDDLLDEVVGRLLAEVWRPEIEECQARPWIAEAAERLRRFLLDQPAALEVYLRHPVTSAAAVDRMEAMVRVLRALTGDEGAARRGYAAIQTYTVGFAAFAASRDRRRGQELAVGGLAEELMGYTTPRQFAEGLRYLLDGIELEARRPAQSPVELTS